MEHIEQQLASRLETATKPMSNRYFSGPDPVTGWATAPNTLKEIKAIKKRFGVTFFVDVRDALAFAKGKGFKVVNRKEDEGSSDALPENEDMSFFYEITDKAGNTVGFASGELDEGTAFIAPTHQKYKQWEAHAHGHEASVEVAADKWWDSLDKKQQDQYIKDHPNSKYAKNAKKGSGGAGLVPKAKRVVTPAQKERKAKMAKKLKQIKQEEKDFHDNIPGYSDLDRKLKEAQEKIKHFGKLAMEAKKRGSTEEFEDYDASLEEWEDKAEDLDNKIYQLTRKYKENKQ